MEDTKVDNARGTVWFAGAWIITVEKYLEPWDQQIKSIANQSRREDRFRRLVFPNSAPKFVNMDLKPMLPVVQLANATILVKGKCTITST